MPLQVFFLRLVTFCLFPPANIHNNEVVFIQLQRRHLHIHTVDGSEILLTTWDVHHPVNNGIKYLSNWLAGCLLYAVDKSTYLQGLLPHA